MPVDPYLALHQGRFAVNHWTQLTLTRRETGSGRPDASEGDRRREAGRGTPEVDGRIRTRGAEHEKQESRTEHEPRNKRQSRKAQRHRKSDATRHHQTRPHWVTNQPHRGLRGRDEPHPWGSWVGNQPHRGSGGQDEPHRREAGSATNRTAGSGIETEPHPWGLDQDEPHPWRDWISNQPHRGNGVRTNRTVGRLGSATNRTAGGWV